MQYRIPSASLGDGWGVYICFTADPVAPIVFHRVNPAGVIQTGFTFYNLAIAPLTATSAVSRSDAFRAKADAWRMAFGSQTIRLDSNALSNQGSVAAAMVPFIPQVANASGITSTGAAVFSASTQGKLGYPVWCYDAPDARSSIDRIRGLPNCYTGDAKEGLYMPLKHSAVEGGWVTSRDLHQTYTLAVDYGTLPGAVSQGFPYYNGALADGTVIGGANAPRNDPVLGYVAGDAIIPCCNLGAAHSVWTNLSDNAALVIDLTLAFEVVPKPGVDWVTFSRRSPMYDSQALLAYELIAGQIADAFPERYNGFDEMWPYINSIANTVLPMLGLRALLVRWWRQLERRRRKPSTQ